MNCIVCREIYNEKERIPLILEGGHTFGKFGLNKCNQFGKKECPKGKAVIGKPIYGIKPNYTVLEMIQEIKDLKDMKHLLNEKGKKLNLIHCEEGNIILLDQNRNLHEDHSCKILKEDQSRQLEGLTFLEELKKQIEIFKSPSILFETFNRVKSCCSNFMDAEVNGLIEKIREEGDKLKNIFSFKYHEEKKIISDVNSFHNQLLVFSKDGDIKNDKFIKMITNPNYHGEPQVEQINLEIKKFTDEGNTFLTRIKHINTHPKVPKLICLSNCLQKNIRDGLRLAMNEGFTKEPNVDFSIPFYRDLSFANINVDYATFHYSQNI